MVRVIKISNFSEVQHIVSAASQVHADVGVHDHRGYIADAKSILGMMSLDYSYPVKVVSDSDAAVNACLSAVS